jgi:hypothetical protein
MSSIGTNKYKSPIPANTIDYICTVSLKWTSKIIYPIGFIIKVTSNNFIETKAI